LIVRLTGEERDPLEECRPALAYLGLLFLEYFEVIGAFEDGEPALGGSRDGGPARHACRAVLFESQLTKASTTMELDCLNPPLEALEPPELTKILAVLLAQLDILFTIESKSFVRFSDSL